MKVINKPNKKQQEEAGEEVKRGEAKKVERTSIAVSLVNLILSRKKRVRFQRREGRKSSPQQLQDQELLLEQNCRTMEMFRISRPL